MDTREKKFNNLFPDEKKFRWRQIQRFIFDPAFSSWNDIKCVPQKIIKVASKEIDWIGCKAEKVFLSRQDKTVKAVLLFVDAGQVETVLMKNSRGTRTICVSCQIGCPIGCVFCATGRMGLVRNLTSDEIVDQLRFWQKHILVHKLKSKITNIVFMGMGEPLANYQNVKESIRQILKYTNIGKTHITVSSSGVLFGLDKILQDKDFPQVRFAISLHASNIETREKLVPTSKDFFEKLKNWSIKFLNNNKTRRNHLTFEYIMIGGLNDSPQQAYELVKYIKSIGNVKVNLIPMNPVVGSSWSSDELALLKFQKIIKNNGVLATVRKSLGQDIEAACGQLISIKKKTDKVLLYK